MSSPEIDDYSQRSTQPTVPDSQGDGESQSSESQNSSQGTSKVWGRLLPVGHNFPVIDLTMETYTFGRDWRCDVYFTHEMVDNETYFLTISKSQFKLVHNKASKSTVIENTSSNGTYVNNKRLKKEKSMFLRNNDAIAVGDKRLKAFVFVDLNSDPNPYCLPRSIHSRYQVTHRLGSGSSGDVLLAFEGDDHKRFAMKIIVKKCTSTKGIRSKTFIENEIRIMQSLSHPCVVQVNKVHDTGNKTFIIMEYMQGGSLRQRLDIPQRMQIQQLQRFCYLLLQGLNYLHANGVAHRDIKPDNILLSSIEANSIIKFSDFGLSKFVEEESLRTYCGSHGYLAPEVVKSKGKNSYTISCDVWSLGVVFYECVSGILPAALDFDRHDMEEIEASISFKGEMWNTIPPEAVQVIKSMLIPDPDKRATVKELLCSPWFKDGHLKKMYRELLESHKKPPKSGEPQPSTSSDRADDTTMINQEDIDAPIAKKARLSLGVMTPPTTYEDRYPFSFYKDDTTKKMKNLSFHQN